MSARLLPLASLAGLLLLAACGPKEVTSEQAEKSLTRGAEDARRVPLDALPVDPNVTASRSVSYMCEGNMPVTAVYGTGPDGQPDAVLVIQGVDVRLQQTVSASGARYEGDPGFSPGNGVVWWAKGDEATLAEFPSGTDSATTMEVKRTCRTRDAEDGLAAGEASPS